LHFGPAQQISSTGGAAHGTTKTQAAQRLSRHLSPGLFPGCRLAAVTPAKFGALSGAQLVMAKGFDGGCTAKIPCYD